MPGKAWPLFFLELSKVLETKSDPSLSFIPRTVEKYLTIAALPIYNHHLEIQNFFCTQ